MATRLYFPADTVADVNPAPGAWNYITEAVFRYLAKTKGSSAITLGTQVGPWTATAGQKALDRVYVSDPLTPQTISGTVKMQLMVREYATTDNVDQINLLIKVVSGNGATVRGTLLALGNYASTAEFINNATHRNKKGADGDALSSVVCQEHDRIVVEIGYCNSVAGTTPEASAKWGENAADLPENETQTTDGAGWIEFSGDIAFSSVPNLDKQVAAGSDDCYRVYTTTPGFSLAFGYFIAGYGLATSSDRGSAARFLGITIPGGSTIDLARFDLVCKVARATTTVNTRIHAEANINPLTFSTEVNFDARVWTTNYMNWDNIPAWTVGATYQSPTNDGVRYFKNIIQEVINLPGWASGNPMVILWDDFENRSTQANYTQRQAYDFDSNPALCPLLHIEYTAGGGAYSLVVDAGSYAVAGTATDLLKDMLISPASGNYALTGVPVDLMKDLLMGAGVGSYALSGSAVDFPVDRVIGAGTGSYSLTGATIALLKDMLISPAVGNYALTGTAVDFLFGKIMAAGSGSYAITGSPIDLIKDLLISAGAGNYALSGSDVGLHRGLVITAGGGTYAISGTAASLLLGRILSAAPGAYAIAGTDADLLKAVIITAGGGTYVLTGSDAGLLYGKIMVAGSGSYVITGSDAGLLADLVMQALGGSYVITGKAATLTSGAIIVVGHPTGYAPFYPTPKDDALHATPMEDDLHATPKRSGSHATPRK